jgi:hypothetical protein
VNEPTLVYQIIDKKALEEIEAGIPHEQVGIRIYDNGLLKGLPAVKGEPQIIVNYYPVHVAKIKASCTCGVHTT